MCWPQANTSQPSVRQNKGPKWWAEQYGTHFIAGYIVGGHMVGIASITSQSSQHAIEVKANLQAKLGCGGLGQAKASADATRNTSMVRLLEIPASAFLFA